MDYTKAAEDFFSCMKAKKRKKSFAETQWECSRWASGFGLSL